MPDHLDDGPTWLVGAGPMAVAYGQVLQAMDQPFHVIGRGSASAERFQESLQVPVHTGGVAACLDHLPAPQTAIVAVSLPELAATTKCLLKAGVSKILLEKPGGLTVAEIDDLERFAAAHSSEVYIAYNRRFNASTQAARDLIEADGGVRSFHFEFTEWSHVIEKLSHSPEVLANWLFANSSHVIDLAFHLGGTPTQMDCQHAGGLPWHPSASVFSGSGSTTSGALFTYQADWESAGRWGVEVLTKKHRLILRPLEQLWVQEKGSVQVTQVDIDDARDQQFKPGLYAEVEDFFADQPQWLPTLAQHKRFASTILQPIAGLAASSQQLGRAG